MGIADLPARVREFALTAMRAGLGYSAPSGEPRPEAESPMPSGREQAYAHFRDAEGEPTLRPASVVFWDVFGFKALSLLTGEQARHKLRVVRNAVEEARERAGTEEPGFLRCSSWFTDNVVIGTPIMDGQDLEMTLGPTFCDVAYMQLILLRHGLAARGGIGFGDVYMDPSFVFGPALIEAYTLQADAGGPGLPCVSVTDEVVAYCLQMARQYHPEPHTSPFASELVFDNRTGTTFVDHLGIWLDEEDDPRVVEHFLPQYRSIIRENLKQLPQTGRAWSKWRWLADYHDWALRSRGWNRRAYLTDLKAQHSFVGFVDVLKGPADP